MLRYFSRQIRKVGKDEGGQSLVFIALVLLVLVAFTAVVINVGHQVNTKIEVQNAADASAVSGATWLARGYNLVAGLNQGMVYVIVAILTIIATWVLLTICVGIPVVGPACGPMWSAYNLNASKVIRQLWEVSLGMDQLQDTIVKVIPPIAQVELFRMARMNKPGAVGIPYPFKPGGNPEDPASLTLHLERGSFADILKKLHLPDWVQEVARIDDAGSVRAETTKRQIIDRDHYQDAINFSEEGKYQRGVGRKIEKRQWYYDHRRWSTRPVDTNDDGKCDKCVRQLEEDKLCELTDWKGAEYVKSERKCCSETVIVEEWQYCRLVLTISAKREGETPRRLPRPMKLSVLFPERDWILTIASDGGKSNKAVFFPELFVQKNTWGTLGVAQSRVFSPSTQPGEMLYEMDWEARLTRVTALQPMLEKLGGDTGEKFKKIAEKFLVH